MGLEAVTWISDLVITNPVGATDPKSQGDDHIRNIKVALKNCFANITGAVTATQAQINQTCVGTGGTFPAINGSALTALNATALASGTVADARLSANIPLLNAATNTFSAASNAARMAIVNQNASIALISFSTNSTLRGYIGADGGGAQIAGATTGDMDFIAQSGAFLFSGNAGTTAHLKLDSSGLVTTPNANAQEVGYQGTPQVNVTGNITLAASHNGKQLYVTGAAAVITVPNTLFAGFSCQIVNNSGGNITLAESTTSLYLAGGGFGAHGTRTIANSGFCALATLGSANQYIVSGVGAS